MRLIISLTAAFCAATLTAGSVIAQDDSAESNAVNLEARVPSSTKMGWNMFDWAASHSTDSQSAGKSSGLSPMPTQLHAKRDEEGTSSTIEDGRARQPSVPALIMNLLDMHSDELDAFNFDGEDAVFNMNTFDADDEDTNNPAKLSKRDHYTPALEKVLDHAIRHWQKADLAIRTKAWNAKLVKAKTESGGQRAKDTVMAGTRPAMNNNVWRWWSDVKARMAEMNVDPARTGPLGSLNCPNGCSKRDVMPVMGFGQDMIGSDHEYDALGWGSKPADSGIHDGKKLNGSR